MRKIGRSKSLLLFGKNAIVSIVIMTIMGCYTIPQESLELNNEVNKGIAENQRAYIALLNAYFECKQQQVDQWIHDEYLPEYIRNIQANLEKSGMSKQLTTDQISDILEDVSLERDSKMKDLERTRIELVTRSNESFALLYSSNDAVSNLLKSEIDIEKIKIDASNKIKEGSKGTVDVKLIENQFNSYLKRVGAASDSATSLYNSIRNMKNN